MAQRQALTSQATPSGSCSHGGPRLGAWPLELSLWPLFQRLIKAFLGNQCLEAIGSLSASLPPQASLGGCLDQGLPHQPPAGLF